MLNGKNVIDGVDFAADANGDEFEVGDVVRLVSGGPDMTVVCICEDCGDVETAWFDAAQLCFGLFPEEALVL